MFTSRYNWSEATIIPSWYSIWTLKWWPIKRTAHHTETWFSLPAIWKTSTRLWRQYNTTIINSVLWTAPRLCANMFVHRCTGLLSMLERVCTHTHTLVIWLHLFLDWFDDGRYLWAKAQTLNKIRRLCLMQRSFLINAIICFACQ